MVFKQKVLKIVSKIPKGKTLTYKQVAELVGSPKAYRAVGNILAKNFNPKIPCHRVIRSNGQPGGYNRGKQNKIKLLKAEKAIKNATFWGCKLSNQCVIFVRPHKNYTLISLMI